MIQKKDLPLFNHQKEAKAFLLSRGGSGALFHEMGLGKTRTALEVFTELRKQDPALRMLVVAPLSLLDAAWGEDNAAFAGYRFQNLHKDFDLTVNADIFAINYEALLRRSKELEKELKKHDWLCVLDESSKIKNGLAQVTKILLNLAPRMKHRIIMTGTPAPNSDIEYWPQLQFVEPGCLGTSLTAFRAHFFHLKNRYTGAVMPAGPFFSRMQAQEAFRKCDYAITDEKRRELAEMMKPICHMAKKKDCLDLPDQIDAIRDIEMSKEQAQAYFDMQRNLILEIQNQVIAAPVALTKIMKLRQITSGFIYNANGEAFEVSQSGGKPDRVIECAPATIGKEFKNPKLAELLEIVEEAGDQPIIIWIQFHWEMIKICHELHKRYPDQVVTISSMTKDRDESIQAFKEGRARFLVAHPASAAHGLTFVNCSLQVFFSLDYSYERYEQARARTHRAGQKNICTYIHLLAKDTIDVLIHHVLINKGDAQKLIVSVFMENAAINDLLKEKGSKTRIPLQ